MRWDDVLYRVCRVVRCGGIGCHRVVWDVMSCMWYGVMWCHEVSRSVMWWDIVVCRGMCYDVLVSWGVEVLWGEMMCYTVYVVWWGELGSDVIRWYEMWCHVCGVVWCGVMRCREVWCGGVFSGRKVLWGWYVMVCGMMWCISCHMMEAVFYFEKVWAVMV